MVGVCRGKEKDREKKCCLKKEKDGKNRAYQSDRSPK
jgi:hypothetical protein